MSSMLVWLPQRLVATETASSRVGKKAKNRLKAMACEIMPHRGKMRENVRTERLKRDAAEIMSQQYKRGGAENGMPSPAFGPVGILTYWFTSQKFKLTTPP